MNGAGIDLELPSWRFRLWKHVHKTDSCWLWTGSLNSMGYGQLQRGARGAGLLLAHRASYEIHHGQIPEGMCVLHRCDTPVCVNPEHLFLGTMKENSDDMVRKGRQHLQRATVTRRREICALMRAKLTPEHDNAKKTACKRGHPFNANTRTYRNKKGYTIRICRKCTQIRKKEARLGR